MSRKEIEVLLNHYRNLYQIVKKDKDELEKELEELKILSTIQHDIITSLNKKIDTLNKNNNVLERNIEELLNSIKATSSIKLDKKQYDYKD
jgi:uncharacterized coiled-coil protein SlyX